MKRLNRVLLLIPLLSIAACAAKPQTGPEVGPMAATGTSASSQNVITEGELRGFATVGQAIRGLRSTWLRPRAGGSMSGSSQIWVYRDGMRMGGVEMLTNLPTGEIRMLEFIEGRLAFQRWGMGHEAGVILLTSRGR
jgi:hypothetical protein